MSALRHYLPFEKRRLHGLTHREAIADLVVEDLRSLTDEYKGPINLGNAFGVVWATDFDTVEGLRSDPAALSDRLGLNWASDATRCLVCAYNRDATGRTLHVPRALDAVDSPQFAVDEDCSADHGRTRPVSYPPEDGLPEAVHRGGSVVPEQWTIESLA